MNQEQRSYLRDVFLNGIPENEKRNIEALEEPKEKPFRVSGVYFRRKLTPQDIVAAVGITPTLCSQPMKVAVCVTLMRWQLRMSRSEIHAAMKISKMRIDNYLRHHYNRIAYNTQYRMLFEEAIDNAHREPLEHRNAA